MKKIIVRLLKKLYGALLKLSFFNKRSVKIKAYIKRYKNLELAKRREKLLRSYKDLTTCETLDAEGIKVTEIVLENKAFEDIKFSFDVLGLVEDIPKMDEVEYLASVKESVNSDDIFARLIYAANKKDSTFFRYAEKELNLYALSDNEILVFKNNNSSFVFIGIELNNELIENKTLSPEILKSIAFAKNIEAEYLAVLVHRGESVSVPGNRAEQSYIRKIANFGCNAIFGFSTNGISVSKGIRREDGEYTDYVFSMGSFFGDHEQAPGSAMAMRYKLVHNTSNDELFINKGYIPIYVNKDEDIYKNVVRIDYHNTEHRKKEKMMNALEYIENETAHIRDVRNVLTIQDICNILNVEMPEKYSYLKNASVGTVCARSFEVNSGDVFFFREQFNDKNDGKQFTLEERMNIVYKALRRGARFIFSYADLGEDIPHVVVGDAREAHITVCAHLRELYEVKTIGITGSVGKTSTKDMLYNVLNERYKTFRNIRNSNTQVKIGMHIQDFRGGYEFFIQEIGGGRPGGASRHSRMILPEAVVVTNIGHAHIGNYGTQEKIMESKLGIVDGMGPTGTIFLNGDDPLLRTAKLDTDTVFYAIDNKDADYYAEDIIEKDGKTYFNIVNGDKKVAAVINVLGHYNVLNAVCSYAIGKKFGLTDEEIVAGIEKFETSGVRQNLIHVAGYNVFLDCFNASPASVESSLSVLDAMETDKKKIAVIGDITGMAELSEEIHEQVGGIVCKHSMDVLVCYGEASKTVYEIAKKNGKNVYWFSEQDKLTRFIKNIINPEDIILFKGSSKMMLAESVDSMFGTMVADQSYIDESNVRKVTLEGVKYNLYPQYAAVTGYVKSRKAVKIHNTIKNKPVYNLGEGAFSGEYSICRISLGENIRHIGQGCFNGSGDLEEINLKNVKFIDNEAFSDCGSLSVVKMNEGLLHIGDKAFYNCSELLELELPKSVLEIGKNAFDKCNNLTIKCHKGTYAEEYCVENKVDYVTV